MIKTDIVSGFLGAGKTTFIKELISKVFKNEKIVLIENEFGEAGIDSLFMKNSDIQITEMNSGCICCTLAGDFTKALTEVAEQYHPDRIIIEPSGVGMLSDVSAAVKKASKSFDIVINSIITVVDGKKLNIYLENFGEFYSNQLSHASTIVISRTQILDEEALKKCLHLIKEYNSNATIITTPWKELTGDMIQKAISHDKASIDEGSCVHEHFHEHSHDHSHEHSHDHYDKQHDYYKHLHEHENFHDDCCHHEHPHADEIFDSWSCETVHKFAESELKDLLKLLNVNSGFGNILRAKGIVESDDGGWFEFDMVPGESEIRKSAADYTSRISIIGTNLKTEMLAEIFNL